MYTDLLAQLCREGDPALGCFYSQPLLYSPALHHNGTQKCLDDWAEIVTAHNFIFVHPQITVSLLSFERFSFKVAFLIKVALKTCVLLFAGY